jgi:uncharacterized protein DUF4154
MALVAVVLASPALSRGTAPAGGPAVAASETRSEGEKREYQIKAAFLLNFVRYTTWPKECFEDAQAPIVLAVIGRDPFGDILETTFRGEEANGRKIRVTRHREVPARIEGHLAFCGGLEREERQRLLERCRKQPVLLVGETPDFARDGACINFYLQDQKTRFEINTEALAEATLELSPAVLKLARIVKTRREDK